LPKCAPTHYSVVAGYISGERAEHIEGKLMKRIAVIAAGLALALGAPVGAFVLNRGDDLANQGVSTITGFPLENSPAHNVNFGIDEQTLLSGTSSISATEASNVTQLQAAGDTEAFSVSEPAASSGPRAGQSTTVPMPRAGWIGLTGVLGVIALRWFSMARRFRTKAAMLN
jgi:hypothetical protein